MNKMHMVVIAAALTVARSASAVLYANGNAGDWNIWNPDPAPDGSYGGSASVTTANAGGPNGGGYSIIPNVYPGQDGGAYTFFGTGSSTPPPAVSSSDFTQSIAIFLEPTVEVGNMQIDETPSSTVLQNDGYGNFSYQLWAAENGFNLSGNGSAITVSSEPNESIGTITAAGWYQFNLEFSITGETLSVVDLTTSSTVGSVNSSTVPGADLAGSGYLWFTEWGGTFTDPGTLDVADLAAIPVPEASTVFAGALLLLPIGLSTFRILRKRRMA